MKLLKVAVFDDNKPRRDLLEMLLENSTGFQCVGAFEDCRDVLKKIASKLPDIILMDIDMPNVNGIDGLKIIKKQFPNVKILMQTIFEDEDKIFQSILAGADGYILKKTPPAKLLEALADVAEGGAPMTPVVAKKVLWLFNNRQSQKPHFSDFNLSKRELEILNYLMEGHSYKVIADKCSISYSTVNSHISHLYEKLQVKSGTEAIAKVMETRGG